MKNIFNHTNKQDHFEGYSKGLDPQIKFDGNNYSEAFLSGFMLGRSDYERMNGYISDGIPQNIVTNKVLEDFLMAGMFGLDIDADGYTPYQLSIIQKWYQSGIEKYNPNQSIYLQSILEENGIEMN